MHMVPGKHITGKFKGNRQNITAQFCFYNDSAVYQKNKHCVMGFMYFLLLLHFLFPPRAVFFWINA